MEGGGVGEGQGQSEAAWLWRLFRLALSSCLWVGLASCSGGSDQREQGREAPRGSRVPRLGHQAGRELEGQGGRMQLG